jgi:hypothetical protein
LFAPETRRAGARRMPIGETAGAQPHADPA